MAVIRGAILPGGGLKGYLTLAIILNFERVTGLSFFKYFNVCYGQSTGALEGSLLFGGVAGSRISDFYLYNGQNIFTPQHSILNPWGKFWDPKYDRDRVLGPYRELLQEAKIERYGDIKKLFVCGAVNQCTLENVFFKTTSEKWADRKIEDIIVRSFAAPNYFGKYVDPTDGTVWSDGGAGDMNYPIDPCYTECCAMASPGDSIEIVLFGTGIPDYTTPCSKVSKYNKYSELWHSYFANGELLARIQSYFTQVNAMRWKAKHLPNVSFTVYNPTIPKKIDVIDGWRFLDEYRQIGNSVDIG